MCEGNTREERWNNAIREASSSREMRQQVLQRAGILDQRGQLSPMYR